VRTDDLINALVEDLRPASPAVLGRGIMVSWTLGAALALFILVFGLGGWLNFDIAAHGWALWAKWLYTAPICVGSLFAARALAVPAERVPMSSCIAIFSTVLLIGMATSELCHTSVWGWLSLFLGHTWLSCPGRILLIAIPILAVLMWRIRQAAPTRLRLTGAATGLASGASAAALYALGCSETSACFIVAWYSLGIAGVAAIGALLGPVLLRW
jgi:hypothetical protein